MPLAPAAPSPAESPAAESPAAELRSGETPPGASRPGASRLGGARLGASRPGDPPPAPSTLRALCWPVGLLHLLTGALAVGFDIPFLRALGLGIPAALTGLALLLAPLLAERGAALGGATSPSIAPGRQVSPALLAAAALLAHGVVVSALVLRAGGEVYAATWLIRLVLVILLLRHACRARPRAAAGGPGSPGVAASGRTAA